MAKKQNQTRAFLEALFVDDSYLIEFRLIESYIDENGNKKGGAPQRFWSTTKDVGKLIEQFKAANKNDHKNIFFGVNPRPAKNTGKKKDIKKVVCLQVDVDDCKPDEFKKRHKELGIPKPSIVVNSGNGIHAYWLLTEPFSIKDKQSLDRIETAIQRLLYAYRGDKGTWDISRILRLPHPELHNVKNQRNGQKSKPVTIVHPKDFDTVERYKLVDIESKLTLVDGVEQSTQVGDDKTPPVSSNVTHTATSQASSCESQASVASLLHSLEQEHEDRSKHDQGIIIGFVKLGMKKAEVWKLVQSKSKFATDGNKYFERTWRYAKNNVNSTDTETTTASEYVKPRVKKIPVFPIQYLPLEMREAVEESCRICGGSEGARASAAIWALATIAGSTGNLYAVEQSDVYALGTSFYFTIVGDSGSNKTNAGRPIVKKFIDLQPKFQTEFNKRQPAHRGTLKVINQQIKKLESKANKEADNPVQIETITKLIQAKEEEKQDLIDKNLGGDWIIDDITPEEMHIKMGRTYGRVVCLSSESKFAQNIMGHYNAGQSSLSMLLKAWDRELLKRERVTSKDDLFKSEVSIDCPSVVQLQTYTPVNWQNMLKNDQFRTSGYLQRSLIISIESTEKTFELKKFDSAIQSKWDSLVTDLCSIPVPMLDDKVTPKTISISDEDYKEVVERFQWMEGKFWGKNAEWGQELNEWKKRFNIQILHIAALFHLIRYKSDFANHAIKLEDVVAAEKVYMYFARQFQRTLDLGKAGIQTNNVTKVIAWIIKQDKPVTKPQVARNVRLDGEGTKTALAALALDEAKENGWLSYNTSNKTYAVTSEYLQDHKGGKQ